MNVVEPRRTSERRPRVVLVHPQCFSERDMQWYALLQNEFEVLAVTPRWIPARRGYPEIPQIDLVSVDQLIGRLGPVQKVLDSAAGLRSENLYWFFGLEARLAGADIVECRETFHPYCLQALRAQRRHGFGLVFSVHENIAFAHENLAVRRTIKANVFKRGDAFVAISQQGANSLLLEGAPQERIRVTGNAVDTRRYSPGAPDKSNIDSLGIPPIDAGNAREPCLRVLCAGRLVWEKGALDALESIALLSRRFHVKAHLVIAGDGPERERGQWLAKRMGISASVTFTGRVTSDQMIALYRWAQVCVVPSIPTIKWQEQFGCILIEAMACGCPVVASDTGSIAEVVGDAALLVPPCQHTRLAQALAALACDPDRRGSMSAAGRKRVVELYDNRIIAGKIAEIYRDVIRERHAAGSHPASAL